ncbi:MAG TPA: hypothetical protein VKD22_03335 [Ramlibacter sp.]|nr:hypothetical protein [Ramlibacter sp.]
METGADHFDALPSVLYVFVDEEDNTVLAALQEERGVSPPFPMLAVDEELLPRYVQLARAYGRREGRTYRLFRFGSCVEVDMTALAPVRQRPALRLVPGGLPP